MDKVQKPSNFGFKFRRDCTPFTGDEDEYTNDFKWYSRNPFDLNQVGVEAR
jgi:hypothetical protein